MTIGPTGPAGPPGKTTHYPNVFVLVVAIASISAMSIAALIVGQATIAAVGFGAVAGVIGGHLNGAQP